MIWTNSEDSIIFNNWKKQSTQELCTLLPHRTYNAIKARINTLGLKRRPDIGLDRNFFSVVDTPKKAYLLGVLEAEGCIGHNRIQLVIGDKDLDWLVQLRNLTGSHATVSKHPAPLGLAYGVAFSSKQWVQDLAKLRFRSGHLPCLDENFMRYYLRGLFDGDGCICWDSDNACYISLFYGSKSLIPKVAQWLSRYIDNVNSAKAGRTCWNTKLGRLATIELTNYLPQKEEYFLQRKCRLMTEAILNQEEKVERLIHKAVLEFDSASCYAGWKKELIGNGWTRFSREHVVIEVFNRPNEDDAFFPEDKIKLRIWTGGQLREQAIKPGYIDINRYHSLTHLAAMATLDGVEQHVYEE